MKTMLLPVALLTLFSSCVFEAPFETTAKVPVDQALLGCWQEVESGGNSTGDRMLVLQHSANEYVAEYPVGDKAMFFRALAVDLAGQRFIQIQLIGTADGPVKSEDRKYHLLKMEEKEDELEMRIIDPDALGKDIKGTDALRDALATHVNDPRLFGKPVTFRRRKAP